jgi:hypothetical protein
VCLSNKAVMQSILSGRWVFRLDHPWLAFLKHKSFLFQKLYYPPPTADSKDHGPRHALRARLLLISLVLFSRLMNPGFVRM